MQVGVGFIELIENDDAQRILQDWPRERAADFVARHSRRRTDERKDILGLLVLVHPENHDLGVGIEGIRDELGKEGLAGARGTREKKCAEKLARPREREIALQFRDDAFGRGILPAHIFFQPRDHPRKIERPELDVIHSARFPALRAFLPDLLPQQPAEARE